MGKNVQMIKLPLYNVNIHIEVLKTPQLLKRRSNFLCKKFNVKEEFPDSMYDGVVIPADNNYYLLLSKDHITDNLISHEVFHLTVRIAWDNGITILPENDENIAILNGFLNQEVRKFINKKWQIQSK